MASSAERFADDRLGIGILAIADRFGGYPHDAPAAGEFRSRFIATDRFDTKNPGLRTSENDNRLHC
ncbi:hypothetical protein AWL63_24080 (plasmid) [Sphingomonas panacis]|uniref:Uncharacterized protein n=1 Tax=Sphingomonas panacis TaxID=1560345 RepID=A0A1B3ZII2_9SPHN|nr:hypothetical protein AWL63_24080 [Sphingomonas panacis]